MACSAQSLHAVCEFGEYVPIAHAVQVVAPVPVSVFVILPGEQVVHAVCEFGEYVPAAHAVHEIAPLAVPVFVTLPGLQGTQLLSP